MVMSRIPILNSVPAGFLDTVKGDGLKRIVPADATTSKLIMQIVIRVWRILAGTAPLYPYTIAGLFLYDHNECEGEFAITHGICLQQRRKTNGEQRAIIGLTTAAVSRGEDYTAFVLLHEIAHAATGDGHTMQFQQYLDYLIMTYNAKYGTNLQNDYSGGFDDEESSPAR